MAHGFTQTCGQKSWKLDEVVLFILDIISYHDLPRIMIHFAMISHSCWCCFQISVTLVIRGNKCDLSSKKVVSYDEAKDSKKAFVVGPFDYSEFALRMFIHENHHD